MCKYPPLVGQVHISSVRLWAQRLQPLSPDFTALLWPINIQEGYFTKKCILFEALHLLSKLTGLAILRPPSFLEATDHLNAHKEIKSFQSKVWKKVKKNLHKLHLSPLSPPSCPHPSECLQRQKWARNNAARELLVKTGSEKGAHRHHWLVLTHS